MHDQVPGPVIRHLIEQGTGSVLASSIAALTGTPNPE